MEHIKRIDELIDGINNEDQSLKTAIKTSPRPDLDNWQEILETLKIHPEQEQGQPPIIIRIDNERFGSLGDFSMIIGKAKSRKTFLISLLLSASVKTETL